MAKRRVEHLTEFNEENLQKLNQSLEELAGEVKDAHIADGASIAATKIRHKDIGEVTVGTSATVIRHNLGVVPLFIGITMRTTGDIWEDPSQRADTSRAWLIADSSGRKAHVVAFG